MSTLAIILLGCSLAAVGLRHFIAWKEWRERLQPETEESRYFEGDLDWPPKPVHHLGHTRVGLERDRWAERDYWKDAA